MLNSIRIGLDKGLPVKIGESDQFRGMCLMGQPGAGKSSLIERIVQSHCSFGKLRPGIVVVDPSGSLAQNVYSLAGGYYVSLEHPIGLNPMLDGATPNDVADNLIEVINQVVKQSTENVPLTVRMRSILTEAVVWCCEHNQYTLDAVVDYLKNRCQGHHETRQGLIDRLNMFIQDPRLRKILCEADPVSYKDIADNGKTLIVDCHGMSQDKMLFIGNIVTFGVKTYFRSSKGPFNPLVVIIDECHNFINSNWLTLLKEGRKYKICPILATQDFTSMPQDLVGVMLSNIGTIISFRVGFKEATMIAREFSSIQAQDLQTLEKYFCAYRTPKSEGICKTIPPPFVKPRDINQPEACREEDFDWFTVEGPCQ